MTAKERLAAPTLIIYWLSLIFGLGLYAWLRTDDPWLTTPLWIGAIGGTVLGQILALRDIRIGVIIGIVVGMYVLVAPSSAGHTPDEKLFWMAFGPATVCGALALSHRGGLMAFWFPVVLWMLSILDRASGSTVIRGSGAVLLGVIAIVFVAFLYAKESRRAGMWQTISPMKLAVVKPVAVLQQKPTAKLGRIGWAMVIGWTTFAATAWLAPRLWQLETFDAPDEIVDHYKNDEHVVGVKCCHFEETIDFERARVKEYFDLGRGRDEERDREFTEACVPCKNGQPLTSPWYASDYTVLGDWEPYAGPHYDTDWQPSHASTDWSHGGSYKDVYDPPTRRPSRSTNRTRNTWQPPAETYRDDAILSHETEQPMEAAPRVPPRKYWPQIAYNPPPRVHEPRPARIDPPKPRIEPPKPKVEEPKPEVEKPKPTEPPPEVEEPKPPEPQPPEVEEPPQVAAAPETSPTPPQPAVAETVPPKPAAPAQTRAPRAADKGAPLVDWLLAILAGAAGLQILILGIRPIRRYATLRHLRRPFWDETVDQRISNFWQLVLVGLRDSGYRTTTGEQPREFAQRTNIDGVEQCATILERARHGIALDADDLSTMEKSAETAFASSRKSLTPFGRILGWFRRPLA